MTRPVLIGITGPDKVGKSTTSKALAVVLGSTVIQSFADPLYATVAQLVGCGVQDLKAHKEEDFAGWLPNCPDGLKGKTPRTVMRWFGTDVMRNQLHMDFWTQRAYAAAMAQDAAYVIFDDARFPNEYRMCDVTVQLSREGVTYSNAHVSDTAPSPEFMQIVIDLTGREPMSAAAMLSREIRNYLSSKATGRQATIVK